jgi:hypothetical protein
MLSGFCKEATHTPFENIFLLSAAMTAQPPGATLTAWS